MFQLETLSLLQFKNYDRSQFRFDQRIVGITGRNGMGKTNLLDAIHYLCFTRSYFSSQDQLSVRFQTEGFRLEGQFQRLGMPQQVSCSLKRGKKSMEVNGEDLQKFSSHIGQLPAVFIAPDDVELIAGGSELRRRFLDTLLAQLDREYLEQLMAYQRVLQQRNSLLKQAAGDRTADWQLLDVLDRQLSAHGRSLYDTRKAFIDQFHAQVQQYYHSLSQGQEIVRLRYQSSLHRTDLLDSLLENRQRDLILQRTTEGIHRDDLVFELDHHLLRQGGSQGQRKSFLFALKLAQHEILRSHKGFPPLLLLDDVFEKLDAQRMSRLLALIAAPEFGQVFITDTDPVRLQQEFSEAGAPMQLIELG